VKPIIAMVDGNRQEFLDASWFKLFAVTIFFNIGEFSLYQCMVSKIQRI
jgi:hypothetical protein